MNFQTHILNLGGCLESRLALGAVGSEFRLQAVPGPRRLKSELQTGVSKQALSELEIILIFQMT